VTDFWMGGGKVTRLVNNVASSSSEDVSDEDALCFACPSLSFFLS
jgi:hypothetical protein